MFLLHSYWLLVELSCCIVVYVTKDKLGPQNLKVGNTPMTTPSIGKYYYPQGKYLLRSIQRQEGRHEICIYGLFLVTMDE